MTRAAFSPALADAGSLPPREDEVRRIVRELLAAYEAAKARGVRDVDIAGEHNRSAAAILSRLLRDLRSGDPPAIKDRTIEWLCKAIEEEPVIVPKEIAEQVRRMAREARKARPPR